MTLFERTSEVQSFSGFLRRDYTVHPLTKKQRDYFKKFLSKKELLDPKLMSYQDQVQDMYIMERMLCKKMVSDILGVPFRCISIERGPCGEPRVMLSMLRTKEANIGISHTDKCLSIGFSEKYNFGIDCQKKYSFSAPNFVQSVFSERENQLICKNNFMSTDQAYTLFWTLKECFVKLLKTGFRWNPGSVEILDFDYNSHKLKIKYLGKSFQLMASYTYNDNIWFTNLLMAK